MLCPQFHIIVYRDLCTEVSKVLQCYIDYGNEKSQLYFARDRVLEVLVFKVSHKNIYNFTTWLVFF